MRETVVIERAFEVSRTLEELQAREEAVLDCLRDYNVTGRCSYMALDGLAAICIYHAPDVEAVRSTQRRADLPVQHAWSATLLGTHEPPAAGSIVIIAQREFPTPVTHAYMEEAMRIGGHCLDIHGVTLHTSYLARDGRRGVCVFVAPDAESVRRANQQLKAPVTRAWPARVHHDPLR